MLPLGAPGLSNLLTRAPTPPPLITKGSRQINLPAPANGHIQDNKQRRVSQRGPDSLVPNICPGHGVIHLSVLQPPDHLPFPVTTIGPVHLQRPGVPTVVRPDRSAAPVRLVARPALLALTAVRRTVGGRHAVDALHDVEFAAQGPGGAVVDGVTEHPEGGPDALLLAGAVVTEANGSFKRCDFAGRGCEGLLGLDAGGGPLAGFGLTRDELNSVATG